MTDEKAIEILDNERPHCGEKVIYSEGERCEAYDKAISALRAQKELGDNDELSAAAKYAVDKHADALIERLDALLHKEDSKPNAPLTGWVSVNDRLPEKEGKCIVNDLVLGVQVYYYHPDMICPGWGTVTHWMPLPEPPEEGTK